MSNRGGIVLLLCLALAGCATVPNERPSDFAVVPTNEVVVVEPEPVVAPALPFAKPAPGSAIAPAPGGVQASAPTNRLTETWVPLERWSRSKGFGAPHRFVADGGIAYAVTTGNGTLTLRIASQSARWHGLEFRLGFAPLLINGQPFVQALDVRKNFEPLLAAEAAGPVPGRVIVLDPGHGGADTGAKSAYNGHFEKEYTLDLARRAQALLVAGGDTVFLTRTNDQFLALSNRVAFAEQRQADLFVSLHFNSAFPEQEPAGLETYCLAPAGMPSNLTRGYNDNPAAVFPNNGFDAQNLQLAFRLHSALLDANGHRDRCIRRARFLGVLQGQRLAAVLVENGYLSNPRESKQIADPAYRQKLAEALARALRPGAAAEPGLTNAPTVADGAVGTNGKVN